MNNPTLTEFCFGMIGRADIEGSKSNVAMNAWLPQASSLIRVIADGDKLVPQAPLGAPVPYRAFERWETSPNRLCIASVWHSQNQVHCRLGRLVPIWTIGRRDNWTLAPQGTRAHQSLW